MENKYDKVFEEELVLALNSEEEIKTNKRFQTAVYEFLLKRVIPSHQQDVDFAYEKKGFSERYIETPQLIRESTLEYAATAWAGLYSELKTGEHAGRIRIETFLEKDSPQHVMSLIHTFVSNNIIRDELKQGGVTWKDLDIFVDKLYYAEFEGTDAVRKLVHSFCYKLGTKEVEEVFLDLYYSNKLHTKQDVYIFFTAIYDFRDDIHDVTSLYPDKGDDKESCIYVADINFNLENFVVEKTVGDPHTNKMYKEILKFNDIDFLTILLSRIVCITPKEYVMGHYTFEECVNAISEITANSDLKKAVINRFINSKHLLEIPLEKETFTRKASKLTKRLAKRCSR